MNPLYFIGWFPCKILFKIYFRWEVYHREYVPRQGAAIIASNHASFLDPVLIGTSLPKAIHYFARKSLFKNKIFGTILRIVHAVPVDRDGSGMSGLRTLLELLEKGCCVNLFPEGTRTPDGNLQKAHSGIGLTVVKTNVPVIPVRIFGSYEAYDRKSVFPKPVKIIISYGKPLEFKELREEAKNCSHERLKAIYQEIADQIMEKIGQIRPE